MATVIDTLVTEFKLKTDNYSAGVRQVRTDMASLQRYSAGWNSLGIGTQIAGVLNTAGSVAGSVGEVGAQIAGIVPAVGAAAAATGAAATALGSAGLSAMNASANFESMERTFAGAMGSMEAGKATMKYLEGYAGKSAFGLEALATASKQLAAGGLEVQRFLPLMERIALVASDTDPSGLQEVASAFLRIKGGGFGEAMESLRRAGISANDFRAQGININKGGEVNATAEEFLAALERIGEGRMKRIAELVSAGSATKISNVGDALGIAVRQVGSYLNQEFLPSIEYATSAIKDFAADGGFRLLAESFSALIPTISGPDSARSAMIEFGANMARIPVYIDMFGAVISELLKIAAPALTAGALQAEFEDAGQKAYESFKTILEMQETIRKQKEGKNGGEGPTVSVDVSPVMAGPVNSFLGAIAKNTADTARNTRQDSMASLTIGGGELARRGLDKTELARVLRPRSMSSDPGLREIQTLLTQIAVVIHDSGQRSAERLMLERARAAY